MCWSGEASAVLASVGVCSTIYVAKQGEPKELWLPLGYFSLMELLQAFTYIVIDRCDLPLNALLTFLGMAHIIVQPIFINMVSMHFIPSARKLKIQKIVYSLCVLGILVNTLRILPLDIAGACEIGREPLCSDRWCSVSGSWHIAWEVKANGWKWAGLGYFIPAFLLPIFYGARRFTTYHILIGPVLAWSTTKDLNEWPAVWCLLSIGLLLIAFKTPLRSFLYQEGSSQRLA